MLTKFLVVALIGTAVLLSFVDNTDNVPWQEGDSIIVAPEGYLTKLRKGSFDWVSQENLEGYHKNIYEQQEKERLAKLQNLFDENTNVCINGKDPATLTQQQYINEFISGPCNPVALLPGLSGTSLQVKVDCEVLKAQSPDIFSNCGWQTCNSAQFWLKKPHNEYRLWISGTTSPMAVIMTSKKDKCFGDIIHLNYDSTKTNPADRYTDHTGLSVTWYGNTPESKPDGECGLGAIYEISDDYIVKAAMCDSKGYHSMSDLLKTMGYKTGLTAQAIPYDFRKSIAASESQRYLKRTINQFYDLTGKKTYILGHSLGTLHSTNVMYELTQDEKDKKVAGIMAMGGPLLGATKTWKATLGGDDGFLVDILIGDVGVNYYAQNKMIHSASSVSDLYPKDTFFRHADKEWMKEIKKRQQAEKQYQSTGQFPTTDFGLDWFPTPSSTCGAGFEARDDTCQLHVQDLTEPFLIVEGRQYVAKEESLLKAIEDNIVPDAAAQLKHFYDETRRPKSEEILHPGVPMIIVYGAHSTVPYVMTYNQNPREVTSQSNDFYFPDDVQRTIGDSTVVTASAVVPGIKWIYEHKNGQAIHPTKIVEYCSEFNGSQSSVYDSVKNGERQFTESGYLGLQCQCRNGDVKIDKCSHPCMINDPYLVGFLADLLKSNQKSVLTQTSYSEEQIKNISDQCSNLI